MNSSSAYICIGLGLIIFFIGLFALWYTTKGHITLLYIHSIALLFIFITETLLAITVLMNERTLSCCGVDSYADWFQTPYGSVLGRIPESCCKKLSNHTRARIELKENLPTDINTNTCYEIVILTIKNKYPIFGGIIIGIALSSLIGIILSCFLARQMRKHLYEQVD